MLEIDSWAVSHRVANFFDAEGLAAAGWRGARDRENRGSGPGRKSYLVEESLQHSTVSFLFSSSSSLLFRLSILVNF